MTKLKAIGSRVTELRKRAGLTQEDLAVALGIGRGTLGEIERGTERGGIASMIAIADYFKVPMDWLLCRVVSPGGPLVGQFVDDPDELAFVYFWRSLDRDDREVVVRLLRIPASQTAAG